MIMVCYVLRYKRDELTRRSQVSFIVCHDIEYYNVFLFLFSPCREKETKSFHFQLQGTILPCLTNTCKELVLSDCVCACVFDVEHFVNMECHTSFDRQKRDKTLIKLNIMRVLIEKTHKQMFFFVIFWENHVLPSFLEPGILTEHLSCPFLFF